MESGKIETWNQLTDAIDTGKTLKVGSRVMHSKMLLTWSTDSINKWMKSGRISIYTNRKKLQKERFAKAIWINC